MLKATVSSVMSVCQSVRPHASNTSLPTECIFLKFFIFENFFLKSRANSKILIRMTRTLHDGLMIASGWIRRRVRNVSERAVGKMRIHRLCSFS
jgi:hypothetical protein